MPLTINGTIVAEGNKSKSVDHRFFGSARMTYAICAFIAMILHLCLRNTLSFVILCMVRNDDGFENGNNITASLEMDGRLSWTRSQKFSLLGSFYYGYLITLPIAGRLTDRYGGRLFFIYSIILQAIVFSLTPYLSSINYEIVFAARVIQGLIAGCGSPAIYQLFTKWAHPTERTAALSFAFSGFHVSSLLVFPLSSWFCQMGWEVAFYGVGSFSLIIGICFHWLVYSTPEEHPRLSRGECEYLKTNDRKAAMLKVPWKSILKSVPVYAFVVTHILHTYGVIVLLSLTPSFLKEAIGFPLSMVGLLSSVPFFGSFTCNILTATTFGFIEKRLSLNLTKLRRILYFISSCATIVILTGIILADASQKILVVILTFFLGISTDFGFCGGYWPSLLYLAPSYAGLIAGIANCLATISGFLAPLGVSSIVSEGNKTEWNYVMITMIISYSLAAVVYGLYGSSKLQAWNNKEVAENNENATTKL